MKSNTVAEVPWFFDSNENDFYSTKGKCTEQASWVEEVFIPPLNIPTDEPSEVVPFIPFINSNDEIELVPVRYNDIVRSEKKTTEISKSSDAVEEIEDTRKYHSLYRVLLTHDLSSKVHTGARGLYNTNNMCFFNSMLQVLVHCPSLYALIQNIHENTRRSSNSENEVLDHFVAFAHNYGNVGDLKRAFNADALYNVVCKHPSFNIERNRQEDAQEFLSNLLDALENNFSKASPHEEDDKDALLQLRKRARDIKEASSRNSDEWVEVGQNHKPIETQHAGHQDLENPVQALFGGKFQSTLLKSGAKKASITTEPFSQIPLDISAEEVNSIQQAFDQMLKLEELTLDSAKATKSVKFLRVPPVLVANLKRFTMQMNGGNFEYGKINKKITIDSELKINCGFETIAYKPCGVVYHHGSSPDRGHYTADVQVGDQWYRIDDEQVVPVAEKMVIGESAPNNGTATAYIVFYTRK